MSLTPSKLRAYAKQFEIAPYAPIAAKDCAMLADAMDIADSSARSLIECECKAVGGNAQDGWQWDTTTAAPEVLPIIVKELRYLEARNLLIRKDGEPHVVSFREPT